MAGQGRLSQQGIPLIFWGSMTELVTVLLKASARFLECVPPSKATSLELGLWMRGCSAALV